MDKRWRCGGDYNIYRGYRVGGLDLYEGYGAGGDYKIQPGYGAGGVVNTTIIKVFIGKWPV